MKPFEGRVVSQSHLPVQPADGTALIGDARSDPPRRPTAPQAAHRKPGASLRILPAILVSSRNQREWHEPSGGDRLNLCSEALALCAVRPWSGRLMPLKAACEPIAFT